MLDLSPRPGDALEPGVRERVEILPGTSIRDYAALRRPFADLITVCDVVHHVPVSDRRLFFADLALLVGPGTTLVMKEVRPEGARARLAYLADRYVSGDKQVSFLAEGDLEALVRERLPELIPSRTTLIERDAPNYSIVFRSTPTE